MQKEKCSQTLTYPVLAKEVSGSLKRVEPLLSPKLFVSRYIKGIQQVILDNLGIKYTNEEYKDHINRAVNEVELLLGAPVVVERFTEKLPFDSALYRSFIFSRTSRGPIQCVEGLSIVSSDGVRIFNVPPNWIDNSTFNMSRVTVVPMLTTWQNSGVTSMPYSAGVGLSVLHQMGITWIPGYWGITYTAGLACSLNEIPVPVNDLIGTIAAINILSAIGPLNAWNSVSLSQDAISQSTSGPGNQLFAVRMQDLENKKASLLKSIKKTFNLSIKVSNF